MKKQTLDDLKKNLEAELVAFKKKQKETYDQAKARGAKKEAADRTKKRKTDTRIKIILGGYLLAEVIKTKDKTLVKKVAETLKSERDKELIIKITDSL